MNKFYTDKQLKKIFGMRLSGTALFDPLELGWVCPENRTHRITWSEFNKHIWCHNCEMDYFTFLCPKMMNPFTTPGIFQKETELMASEMAKWTLGSYGRKINHNDDHR